MCLLDAFTVERNIQTLAFLFLRYAQAHGHIDDLQNNKAHHEAVDQGGPDAPKLGDHGAVCAADLLTAERPGEQTPYNPPDPVPPNPINLTHVSPPTLDPT